MENLKLTYYNISQIAVYFKSLEGVPNLSFGTRRALTRFNEAVGKEADALSEEIKKLIDEYSEKDDEGKPIVLENGSIKILPDKLEEADKKLNEIYATECEIEYSPFKIKEDYFERFECSQSTFDIIEKNFIK